MVISDFYSVNLILVGSPWPQCRDAGVLHYRTFRTNGRQCAPVPSGIANSSRGPPSRPTTAPPLPNLQCSRILPSVKLGLIAYYSFNELNRILGFQDFYILTAKNCKSPKSHDLCNFRKFILSNITILSLYFPIIPCRTFFFAKMVMNKTGKILYSDNGFFPVS